MQHVLIAGELENTRPKTGLVTNRSMACARTCGGTGKVPAEEADAAPLPNLTSGSGREKKAGNNPPGTPRFQPVRLEHGINKEGELLWFNGGH
jgi:hypothetical protein